MRKLIAVTVVLALVVVLGVGSVVRVPDGAGAWCAGRYLAPGVHLRFPFAHLEPYPGGEQEIAVERTLGSREGASYDLTVKLRYSWKPEELAVRPLDPRTLGGRVEDLLGGLDGRFSGAGFGEQVKKALRGALEELPITVLGLDVTYPGEALEAMAAMARPTGEKVVLVGLDGFDWVLLNRLIGEGRCPTFARIKSRGAWADLQSHPPVLSPLIWTSMATGRRPEVHGVLDFVVRDPKTGKDVPITNQSRKVHTFWNILSYAGETVDVVNWWATYPAEPVNGVMVSEHLFYQLFGMQLNQRDPANVYPPEVLEQVLPLLVPADDIDYATIRRFANITRAEYDRALAEAAKAENPYENRINHLRKIIATTRGVFNVGHWLLEKHPADLVTLYVEGTDTIGHRFAHFLPPKLDWVSQADYDRYHDTMAAYYQEVDRLMGDLMKAAPPDTTWIITADHGFYTGAARPRVQPDDFGVGAAQWHRMTGVFMAMGPHVRRGKIPRVDIYDLCRTVLWLEGAPISRELEGRVVTELMSPRWVEEHPPIFVTSYTELPLTWKAEGARSVLDEARVKELEALGYLSPGGGSAARQEESSGGEGAGPQAGGVPTPKPAGEATGAGEAKVTELYNLGKLAASRGDLEGAERYYLQALDEHPNFAFGMISLAEVELRLGKADRALFWYTKALETGNRELPQKILVDFVGAAEAAGKLDRVPGALDYIKGTWGDRPAYFSAMGLAMEKMGRTDEAVAQYSEALGRDPAEPVATEGMLRLASKGVRVDTEAILQRHFQAVRHDLKRLNDFAVLCVRQQRPDWAEKALEILVESDPTNAGLIMNLAIVKRQQGKMEESLKLLRKAAALRPEEPGIHYNLGGVLALLGREEEALGEFEKAKSLGLKGPRIYSALAKVQFRLGRIGDVRATLEEGLRANPGNPELQSLLDAFGPAQGP